MHRNHRNEKRPVLTKGQDAYINGVLHKPLRRMQGFEANKTFFPISLHCEAAVQWWIGYY